MRVLEVGLGQDGMGGSWRRWQREVELRERVRRGRNGVDGRAGHRRKLGRRRRDGTRGIHFSVVVVVVVVVMLAGGCGRVCLLGATEDHGGQQRDGVAQGKFRNGLSHASTLIKPCPYRSPAAETRSTPHEQRGEEEKKDERAAYVWLQARFVWGIIAQ